VWRFCCFFNEEAADTHKVVHIVDIATELLAGSRLALSRAITAVENEYDDAVEIMKKIYSHTGKAQVIGITGPPGAGKSTLTDKLVKEYRRQGKTVGIIAIDPTSPFTGGAILGDRIRMNDLTTDEGVFIRSMGTRGSLGGLSRKTAEAVKIMDAFGKDIIFVETVGVGQSEIDIVKMADTTCVILVPGLGDDIQAIKAGILEIGDAFVINKADREGVERLNIELEMMLELDQDKGEWRPPVKRTVAQENTGITELIAVLDEHYHYLMESGQLAERRKKRTKNELVTMIHDDIGRYVSKKIIAGKEFEEILSHVEKRDKDPYTVVNEIITSVLK
jgi:LAO/AO transport system kinase